MKYVNKKINTIIGDNSRDFCEVLNEYLSYQSDIVVTGIANDGVKLLELIREKKPDLVILDIIMPNLDGFKILEKLRAMNIYPLTRVIILSVIGDKEIISRSLKLGADYFIGKPFEFDELIKKIRQMFEDKLDSKNLIKAIT